MQTYHPEFLPRMRALLGTRYPAFEESLHQPPVFGLRVNTLLVRPETLQLPFTVEPLPFCGDGFVAPQPPVGIGHHPLHHAGAFYVQDPSAMLPVCLLEPQLGERILDLCAAPGGKSTQIAARMRGQGTLICNEINRGRANVLLQNIERMGVANAVVTNCRPDELCAPLSEWFDRVLVDAPCSGEGMMRKNPTAAADWSPEHVAGCAVRQREILESAAPCVRPGGLLVYSTCTFSPEENELLVGRFLQDHPEFVLEPARTRFGSASDPAWAPEIENVSFMRRVFPFEGGEGQFAARLRKKGERLPSAPLQPRNRPADGEGVFNAFWRETFMEDPPLCIQQGDKILLPPSFPPVRGILRAGVLAGRVKNNRFVPEHHLFACGFALRSEKHLQLDVEDPRTAAFLRGEEIFCNSSGWVGLSVAGVPLGFGKASRGRLKNHYPKGLRERQA